MEHFRFLDLPLELRQMLAEYIVLGGRATPNRPRTMIIGVGVRPVLTPEFALLRTCWNIHDDLHDYVYDRFAIMVVFRAMPLQLRLDDYVYWRQDQPADMIRALDIVVTVDEIPIPTCVAVSQDPATFLRGFPNLQRVVMRILMPNSMRTANTGMVTYAFVSSLWRVLEAFASVVPETVEVVFRDDPPLTLPGYFFLAPRAVLQAMM